MKAAPKKLLILASGGGELFWAVAEACRQKVLPAVVVGLISDNPHAGACKKACDRGVPVEILPLKKKYSGSDFHKWDQALYLACFKRRPDLIVMAGFLKKLGKRMLTGFRGRILNIHPSLLPRHGGKGMYGLRVHRAVLEAGDQATGVSVHWADESYDHGPVIAQTKVSVHAGDTPLALQARVKQVEKVFYVSVLQKIIRQKGSLSRRAPSPPAALSRLK